MASAVNIYFKVKRVYDDYWIDRTCDFVFNLESAPSAGNSFAFPFDSSISNILLAINKEFPEIELENDFKKKEAVILWHEKKYYYEDDNRTMDADSIWIRNVKDLRTVIQWNMKKCMDGTPIWLQISSRKLKYLTILNHIDSTSPSTSTGKKNLK